MFVDNVTKLFDAMLCVSDTFRSIDFDLHGNKSQNKNRQTEIEVRLAPLFCLISQFG